MSLAVILPNYNHAVWLPRALRALAEQKPPPSRIYVIDDGSTDSSVAIIETLQKRFPFIELIRHETNLGAEAAVAAGIKVAREDFLLFAAADDFVLPGLIARASAALREHPDAAFFCAEVALIDRDDNILGFRPVMLPRTRAGYVSPAQVRQTIRTSDNWFIGTGLVYRRDRLTEIGFFDRSLATLQDAMATRLLALRHGFYFCPEVLATWRVIPESLSVRSSLQIDANEALLQKAEAWIDTHFPDDVKVEYAGLFDRRLRFNFARSRLYWRKDRADAAAVADIFKWGPFDRKIVTIASALPIWSSQAILAWVTLRTRPYGISAMLLSWWRTVTVNRVRKRELAPLLKRYLPQEHG